ncbi:sigma-54-dependent transcriptional regulator [Marinobacterium lutimaris]|uniref:Two component, sigma54 specific, transcriptional regulator, Fis family n=1 Tax=Marinobacterium lutimaris TaxID=568106 RepID=A0A1H5YS90_9GAMM|nr:sigma-54 dependent transcriptional regulator [Marinobacterium lutimaris]SEG26522.1 two component, sigma54 specific, transcriptional regulator, Fis family [Marinobacterium lutimaris]
MAIADAKRIERPVEGALPDISILIVDDEAGIRDFLQRALRKRYRTVDVADSTEQADQLRSSRHFDLLIVDICMPGRSGVEWVQQLRESGCPSDVIFMTAFADMNSAIEALRLGACDLVLKPFRIEQMRNAVQKCLDNRQLTKENYVLNRHVAQRESSGLVGSSAVMEALRTTLSRIAPAPSAVLIEGETGTGKELAARAIHRQSGRSGAFVPVNCGAIAPELIESELFGHIKGAFTNAHQARLGLFAYADGGTLFLDEISELPLPMQTKLLRVLEDGAIRPLGTERDTPVNVRVLAASNKKLDQAVSEGRFREDLYYRLNVLHIQMPPLRERQEDIPELLSHLSTSLATELRQPTTSFDSAEIRALQAYHWPGNVRELKNLIERCLLLGMSPTQLAFPNRVRDAEVSGYPLHWRLKQVELTHIEKVLARSDGNKTRAAEALGITRKTLDRKLRSFESSDDDSSDDSAD